MRKLSWLRTHNLSQQLLFSCGLSLATVGLGTLWINYQLIQSDLEKQVRTRAQIITQSIKFASEGLLEVEQRHILRRILQNYATLPAIIEITIVNGDGTILADSQESQKRLYTDKHPQLRQGIHQSANTEIATTYEMVLDKKPVLVQILPFRSVLFGTSGRRGLAIAIVDLRQMKAQAGKAFLTSTLTLLSGIVIILWLMWVLIRRNVLRPLNILNQAVAISKETATFSMPEKIPANEIQFLANTFQAVFEQLQTHEQLKDEITQRQKVEETLRESEARERSKSEELAQTLQELQQAQIQLVQSEKMSSLGQLVAGVAHEINNPVNFIYGNLGHLDDYSQDLLRVIHLYQEHLKMNPEFQALSEKIDLIYIQEDLPKVITSMKVGTHRIREIVLSLRTFSRLDEAEFKAVEIHEGIDSTLMILQHRLKEQQNRPAIQVIKNYSKLPLLECYAGQINQVFMNILSNAIDTLEERMLKEPLLPKITIHTSLIDSDWVKIAIADNGLGMPENIQKQIFNPFFTTKSVGKGTGMGMSISYQIITEKHKGFLECSSINGAGTEFVIKIPIYQHTAGNS
ncbi:ATP-binding protein [Trichormus sp. NMC-1]|uniref:sensor histidine kinase n=1 Tax=Trichormus sp. NMC-1 TaxID=1853259 RepID=UPI001F2B4105|nr:ATP-binding protein [Trichormus sp. NMC-1]